jgi:3-oxoacyl-(acyl-carrier-protein) synthase III
VTTTVPLPRQEFPTIAPTGAAIASVAASLPQTVVPNGQIAARLGVSDDWIVRRTGIRERRFAEPTERLTAHATNAAAAALRRAGVEPEEIDLVLVATTTADEVMPNAAPLVAHELGAANAGAFDVGAACTGFLSALAVGTGQIESGRARNVVVIGADFMSRITDPEDRSTAAVFADGAGAVVLRPTDDGGRIGPIVLGADGAGADHIVVDRQDGWTRQESAGVIRFGAGFVHAFAAAEVPRVTLILRKAFGGAFITINSKDLGADYVFARPQAQIGVMAARSAVGIIHRRELAAADDPDSLHASLADGYEETQLRPEVAARTGYLDELISPAQTRSRLVSAFRSLGGAA